LQGPLSELMLRALLAILIHRFAALFFILFLFWEHLLAVLLHSFIAFFFWC
jgi:hypothetical protein